MMKNLLVPEQTSWWTFFVQKVLSNSTTSMKSVSRPTEVIIQQKPILFCSLTKIGTSILDSFSDLRPLLETVRIT